MITAPTPAAERPVTSRQTGDYFQVSQKTLSNWRNRGLPYIRINARCFRYRLSEVEKFLAKK